MNKKHALLFCSFFSFVILQFSACSKKINPNIRESQKNIVVSFPYIKDLILNVSCFSANFTVNSILQPGTDPHNYVLSPSDRLAIAKADAVFYVAKGLESWLLKISQNKEQLWFSIAEGMHLQKLISTHAVEKSNELELNYHIWQSPQLTKEAVRKIFVILKTLDPENENKFSACTANYLNAIDAEVTELKKEIAGIPLQNRVLATNHDVFGYFVNEFALRPLTIIGLSDDAAVTLEQLRNVILTVKNDRIPAVFLESTGNVKNIQTVSKETGVKIGGELYGDSLGAKGTGADTVLGMWRTNVKTIVEALK